MLVSSEITTKMSFPNSFSSFSQNGGLRVVCVAESGFSVDECCTETGTLVSLCSCAFCLEKMRQLVESVVDQPCPTCSKVHEGGCVNVGDSWNSVCWDCLSSPLLSQFHNLSFSEQCIAFAQVYQEDRVDPILFKSMIRNLYQTLYEWSPVANSTMAHCDVGGVGWVFKCLCDRPSWDFDVPWSFDSVQPIELFSWFKRHVESFEVIVGRRLDFSLKEPFSLSLFFQSFVDTSSDFPLSIRWASWRLLTLYLPRGSSMRAYARSVAEDIELECVSCCPIPAVAQGVFDETIAWFADVIHTMSDFCEGIANVAVSIWIRIMNSMIVQLIKNPRGVLREFRQFVFEGMMEALETKTKEVVLLVKNFIMSPLVQLLFKTMVRWWNGYSLSQIGVEILWDPDFYDHIPQILSLFNQHLITAKNDPDFVAEAVDASGVMMFVMTLALGSLGTLGTYFGKVDMKHFTTLCRDIYNSASLLDKLGVKDSLDKLFAYITGVDVGAELYIRMKHTYPKTIAFVDQYLQFVEVERPNNSDRRLLKYYYAEFLKERPKWNVKDNVYLSGICSAPVRAVLNIGATDSFAYRRSPSLFVFQGPAGVGKSRCSDALAAAVARKAYGEDTNLADCIYTTNVMDAYSSGYTRQTIWKFDDFLQKVDTAQMPAGDIEILIRMCTSAPFVLNMAMVEDKGRTADCYLTVCASNVSFFSKEGIPLNRKEVLSTHIKSIKCVDAFSRRLTYCILPIIQAPYKYNARAGYIVDDRGRKAVEVPREELYRFFVQTSEGELLPPPDYLESKRMGWRWSQLLSLAWSEFVACRDYDPELEQSKGESDLIDEQFQVGLCEEIRADRKEVPLKVSSALPILRAKAEGWWDAFHSIMVVSGTGLAAYYAPYVADKVSVGSLGGCPCGAHWCSLVCSEQVSTRAMYYLPKDKVTEHGSPDRAHICVPYEAGLAKEKKIWFPLFTKRSGRWSDATLVPFLNPVSIHSCLVQRPAHLFENPVLRTWSGKPIKVCPVFQFEQLIDFVPPKREIYASPLDSQDLQVQDVPPDYFIHCADDLADMLRVEGAKVVNVLADFVEPNEDGSDKYIEGSKTRILVKTEFVAGNRRFVPGWVDVTCVAMWNDSIQHSDSYNPLKAGLATLASALFVPLIGALIGGGISRVIRWKMDNKRDDVAVEVDGEHYFVDEEKGVYVSEAPLNTRSRVFVNGTWWYKVQKKDGTLEWYPQAGENNAFVELLSKSKRLEAQLPTLRDSLWAIVDENNVLLGNVFAIDERRVLTPIHVARVLERGIGLKLKRGCEVRSLCPNFGSEQNVVITPIGSDVAIVEFFSSKLPEVFRSCRAHVSKFSNEPPKTGVCALIRRNALGVLETANGSFSNPSSARVDYSHGDMDYALEPREFRFCDILSQAGWCGGLYINMSPTAEQTCLGIHVARGSKEMNYAVMHLVSENQLRSVDRTSLGTDYVTLQGVPEVGSRFVNNDLTVIGKSAHPPLRPIVTKSSKTKFHDKLQCPFELAKLSTFRRLDGTICNPLDNALRKLGDRVKEDTVGGVGMVEVVHALAAHYGENFVPQPIPDMTQVIRSDIGLPSVQKKKSAGDPYYAWGGLKKVAFVNGIELNTLTPEYAEFMDIYENWLCPADWATRPIADFEIAEAVCNGNVKDEPRLLEKVEKPRLYTAVPMHEFLLQRRYFCDVAHAWTEGNVGYSSALGVPAEEWDIFYLHLLEAGPNCKILALDHEHMDGHIKPRMVRLISLMICLITKSVDNLGRLVDPLFPKLDRRGFIMHKLLVRLSNFYLKILDGICEPGTMHPSGSFLTALINGLTQDLLTVWVFWRITSLPLDEIIVTFPRIFLGDDSLVGIPEKFSHLFKSDDIIRFFKEQGFSVTSADKKSDIRLFEMWSPDSNSFSEFQFLSRRFGVRKVMVKGALHDSIEGFLDPVKIERILCFTKTAKYLENYPQQVLAMLNEMVRYKNCVYEEARVFVDKMRVICEDFGSNFFDRSILVLENGDDTAGIMMEVLRYLQVQEGFVVRGVAQAGEGEVRSLGDGGSEDTTQYFSSVTSDSIDAQGDLHSEDWRLGGMEARSHPDGMIFGRPFIIDSFTWDGSQTGVLGNYAMPSRYFNNNSNARMKLSNFAFMRGVACVRVVMTGSPYTQGKALLSVRPLGRQPATAYEASGDPCVELDASSGKTVELKAPCVIPHGYSLIEYIDGSGVGGSSPYFDWVKFNFCVLSAINNVNTTVCKITVYAWLEETELFGPTFTNFVMTPQMMAAPFGKKIEKKQDSGSFLKSGRINPFKVSIAPTESSERTPAVFKKIAPVVKAIGGVVTDVASIALTVAKVAALAGFSVPAMENNSTMIFPVGHVAGAHLDGISPAVVLGSSQQTKVVLPEKTFCIVADEMDIRHFCSRMGFCCIRGWTSADPAQTTLLNFPVTPGCCHISGGVAQWTPLSKVSSFFRFWRGSLIYRLAAVKTQFHSGVLEVVWQMGTGRSSITSDQQSTLCHRFIWDIAESSSVQFTVPYISPLSFTPVMITNMADDYVPIDINDWMLNGTIQVRVINPLLTSDGLVTDNIQIMIYCGGGDDLEFCVPSSGAGFFTFEPGRRAGIKEKEKEKEEVNFVAQVGGVYQDDQTDGVESEQNFLMAPARPLNEVALMSCVGERITNLRPLLRRFSPYYVATEMTYDFVNTYYPVEYADFFENHPFLNQFISMFAFFSGGFRVELKFPDALAGETRPKQLNATLQFDQQVLEGMPVYEIDIDAPFTVLQVPYMSVTPYLPVFMLSTTSSDNMPSTALFLAAFNEVAPYTFQMKVAGADDFTLGWQIGPVASTVPFGYQQNPDWFRSNYAIYE